MTATRAANLMSRPRRDPVEIGMLVVGVIVMVVVLLFNTVAFVPADDRVEPMNGETLTAVPQQVEPAVRSPFAGGDTRFEIHRSDELPTKQLVLGETDGVAHVYTMERSESMTATGTRESKPLTIQRFAPSFTFDSMCADWFTPAPPAPSVKNVAAPNVEAPVSDNDFWSDLALDLQRWFPGVGTLIERFMANI